MYPKLVKNYKSFKGPESLLPCPKGRATGQCSIIIKTLEGDRLRKQKESAYYHC